MGCHQTIKILTILFVNLYFSAAEEEYFGMCGDPDCTVLLAEGRTSQRCLPGDQKGLALESNTNVDIYVREYGPKKTLLGVKVGDKKGYVPKSMIIEGKVFEKVVMRAQRNFADDMPVISVAHSVSSASHEETLESTLMPTQADVSSSGQESSSSSSSSSSLLSTTLPDSPINDASPLQPSLAETEVSLIETSSNVFVSPLNSQTVPPAIDDQNGASTASIEDLDSSFDQPVVSSPSPIGADVTPNIPLDVSPSSLETVLDETPNIVNVGHISASSSILIEDKPSSSFISSANEDFDAQSSSVESSSSMHSNVDDLPSSRGSILPSEDVAKALYARTERSVKETVDLMVKHATKSSAFSSLVDNGDPIELQKTLDMLVQHGVNLNYISNTEAIYSNVDSSFDSSSRDHHNSVPSGFLPPVNSDLESDRFSPKGIMPTGFPTNTVPHNLQGISSSEGLEHQKYHEINEEKIKQEHKKETEFPGNSETQINGDVMDLGDEENDKEEVDEESDDYDNSEIDDDEGTEPFVDDDSMPEIAISEKSNQYETSATQKIFQEDNRNKFVLSKEGRPLPTENVIVTENFNSDQPVPSSDSITNYSDRTELLKGKEYDEHEDTEEDYSREETTEEDYFTTALPSQRHILQDDNNSDPVEESDDSKISGDSGSTLPLDNPSESPDSHNPYKEEEEDIVVSSGLFNLDSMYETFGNTIAVIRIGLDYVLLWVPEPIHSYLSVSGISARAVVFTMFIAFPCALLFLATFFLKEKSKEQILIDQLRDVEHKLYLASTERDILRDETVNLKKQLIDTDTSLSEVQYTLAEKDKELQHEQYRNEDVGSKQQVNEGVIKELKSKNAAYEKEVRELRFSLSESEKQRYELNEQLREEQNAVTGMSEEMLKLKTEIEEIESEMESNRNNYYESEEKYKEKIAQLEQSCTQLLQEGEVWNTRVNELTEQVYSHVSMKEELEKLVESKESELEALKTAFSNLEVFQKLKDSGEDESIDEKMQAFMDVSAVQNKLQKAEDVNKSLAERLQQEKQKLLDFEVELLEAKSDVEKTKTSYNQALQDKTEAQTKLDVLTKYFKDKELQLQKELGVQEAVRQRKEEDATHAERRVLLIEKENESYKYQVATLKQEIEETERNLKNQITMHEKKAHENWLAARAAERKLEEVKQESVHLRQRLTLLEREQENWMNSSQSDIVRPVPQRLSDAHDLSSSHEGSISSEFVPRHIPPPGMLDDLPMPLRPPSRPLLPPGAPLMPPHFMPPFDPMLHLPPHRPQPWRMLQEKHFDSQRRNTPSDFEASMPRRHQTPPYYESDRHSSSPVDGNSRSRGSTPPEALPDFHNVPPPLHRHPEYMPPPPQLSRFPPAMHRPYKGLPSPRSGNRVGGNLDNNRSMNDKELRRPHPDVDV